MQLKETSAWLLDETVTFVSRQGTATYRTTGNVSISRQQRSTCETHTLQARPCLLQFLGISRTWMRTERAEIWLRKGGYASHWPQSYARHQKMAYYTCVWSGWSCKMCKACEWHYFWRGNYAEASGCLGYTMSCLTTFQTSIIQSITSQKTKIFRL